jgi:hypothetical protein
MDLRKHINEETGGALKHHRVLEGGCREGGIYYLMFGNMKKKTTVVCKLMAGKEKTVLGVSKPLKIGHANDCCVRGNIILVTHSGKRNVIHRVSANTLTKLPDVNVSGCKGGFNGIACMSENYLLKKMGSKKCYVVDSAFRYKNTIKLSKTKKIGQGITYHDGRIYRATSIGQSKRNYVMVYNRHGKLLKTYHYKHKCEIEDVFVAGDNIRISIYRKRKKNGKKHFEAFIRTLAKVR